MGKILFIGDLNQYGRSYMRCRTLVELGHEVIAYSHTFISPPKTIRRPSVKYRISCKLRLPLDDRNINAVIMEEVEREDFDVIWIDKGNMIYPWTLKALNIVAPKTKLISCSEDDMYARHGHSLWYRWGLSHYDCVFTTKKYNLEELKKFGARRTRLFLDSYDEKIHHPMQLAEGERMQFGSSVGAIGAFEPERAKSLRFLAENGIKVVVWGNGWNSLIDSHPNLIIKDRFLFGDEYAKAICATEINLSFLRKINRDQVTSRSVEIPACGGFMLAERTQRHQEFFVEGKEAEFFSTDIELLEKINKYLMLKQERERIGTAGRKRCVTSGYSMRDQLSKMIDYAVGLVR
ncbi:MAG: glycosyltransferase [Sphingomonadales bacterium]|nr:glycosyltransferase [Sphingomonadales bacterium]